jgi:hypothetical protein
MESDPDPLVRGTDPQQNVTDPQHWLVRRKKKEDLHGLFLQPPGVAHREALPAVRIVEDGKRRRHRMMMDGWNKKDIFLQKKFCVSYGFQCPLLQLSTVTYVTS